MQILRQIFKKTVILLSVKSIFLLKLLSVKSKLYKILLSVKSTKPKNDGIVI